MALEIAVKKTIRKSSAFIFIFLALITSAFIFAKSSISGIWGIRSESSDRTSSSEPLRGLIPVVYADTVVSGGTGGDDGGDAGDSSGGGGCGNSGGCFFAGTPILMADLSTKPIQDIQIGDRVLSFTEFGELIPQRVMALYVHDNKKIYDLNGTKVTLAHRFLTEGGTYKSLKDIHEGETLFSVSGEKINGWKLVEVSGEHTVYNFTVENTHTYIAGSFRVHNAKGV